MPLLDLLKALLQLLNAINAECYKRSVDLGQIPMVFPIVLGQPQKSLSDFIGDKRERVGDMDTIVLNDWFFVFQKLLAIILKKYPLIKELPKADIKIDSRLEDCMRAIATLRDFNDFCFDDVASVQFPFSLTNKSLKVTEVLRQFANYKEYLIDTSTMPKFLDRMRFLPPFSEDNEPAGKTITIKAKVSPLIQNLGDAFLRQNKELDEQILFLKYLMPTIYKVPLYFKETNPYVINNVFIKGNKDNYILTCLPESKEWFVRRIDELNAKPSESNKGQVFRVPEKYKMPFMNVLKLNAPLENVRVSNKSYKIKFASELFALRDDISLSNNIPELEDFAAKPHHLLLLGPPELILPAAEAFARDTANMHGFRYIVERDYLDANSWPPDLIAKKLDELTHPYPRVIVIDHAEKLNMDVLFYHMSPTSDKSPKNRVFFVLVSTKRDLFLKPPESVFELIKKKQPDVKWSVILSLKNLDRIVASNRTKVRAIWESEGFFKPSLLERFHVLYFMTQQVLVPIKKKADLIFHIGKMSNLIVEGTNEIDNIAASTIKKIIEYYKDLASNGENLYFGLTRKGREFHKVIAISNPIKITPQKIQQDMPNFKNLQYRDELRGFYVGDPADWYKTVRYTKMENEELYVAVIEFPEETPYIFHQMRDFTWEIFVISYLPIMPKKFVPLEDFFGSEISDEEAYAGDEEDEGDAARPLLKF